MTAKNETPAVPTCDAPKCKRHVFDRGLCLEHLRKSLEPTYKKIANGDTEVKPTE